MSGDAAGRRMGVAGPDPRYEPVCPGLRTSDPCQLPGVTYTSESSHRQADRTRDSVAETFIRLEAQLRTKSTKILHKLRGNYFPRRQQIHQLKQLRSSNIHVFGDNSQFVPPMSMGRRTYELLYTTLQNYTDGLREVEWQEFRHRRLGPRTRKRPQHSYQGQYRALQKLSCHLICFLHLHVANLFDPKPLVSNRELSREFTIKSRTLRRKSRLRASIEAYVLVRSFRDDYLTFARAAFNSLHTDVPEQ